MRNISYENVRFLCFETETANISVRLDFLKCVQICIFSKRNSVEKVCVDVLVRNTNQCSDDDI